MYSKLLAFLLASALQLSAAATVIVLNGDPPGIGFNDTTPASPVGGNPGTTVGQQRLIAAQFAANIWGSTLNSTVPILVLVNWDALPCNATSAVLASTGPDTVHANFPGAIVPNVWYVQALANKLSGSDLSTVYPDIESTFNINLGVGGCFTGGGWYYGLTPVSPTGGTTMVSVALHEFAHGLGFLSLYNEANGQPFAGLDDIYSHFLFDRSFGNTWPNLTPAQRVVSAVSRTNLVWSGPQVIADVPSVLSPTPRLIVNAPFEISGTYEVGSASFGPPLTLAGTVGEVMPIVDTVAPGPGCNPFTPQNAAAVNGKIALIDRGGCNFTVKAKNAQDAGAIAVLIGDNVPGSPPPALGGSDPTVTIPAVRITLDDANRLRTVLAFRSRTRSGLNVVLNLDPTRLAGADPSSRPLMYAPNPIEPGSSISHWDTSLTPNQIMEPAVNPDLLFQLTPPRDLTYSLFRDIGWVP